MASIIAARVKPNYTEKQNQIADWIVLGHDAEVIRSTQKTRCYITTGEQSHWYNILKTGELSRRPGTALPDGNFIAYGNCPGSGLTTVNNSRFCGVAVFSIDRCRPKKSKRRFLS